ncbi:MAG: sarcosine oxidase subunit delta [Deltaproteobacteria bacterium]|nr:sarcosine oxidase subunit delta [Deltaproteobacteria bacterium]
MGFKIPCPNCGPRSAYEFKYDREVKAQPGSDADLRDWRHYIYFNDNVSGVREEWWCHSFGCGCWMKIKRNTATNEIIED